jgi:hypothetical protein
MFDEPFEFVLEDEAAGKDPGRVAPMMDPSVKTKF